MRMCARRVRLIHLRAYIRMCVLRSCMCAVWVCRPLHCAANCTHEKIMGLAMQQRQSRGTWVHKICISPAWLRSGNVRCVLRAVQLHRIKCDNNVSHSKVASSVRCYGSCCRRWGERGVDFFRDLLFCRVCLGYRLMSMQLGWFDLSSVSILWPVSWIWHMQMVWFVIGRGSDSGSNTWLWNVLDQYMYKYIIIQEHSRSVLKCD